MTQKSRTVWSWVNVDPKKMPTPKGPGRFIRPLAVRDQIIALSFGAEVKRLMDKQELSVAALAQLVGVSVPSIYKIINGQIVNVELRMIWDYAEAFQVEPNHFMKVCNKAVAAAQLDFESKKKKA